MYPAKERGRYAGWMSIINALTLAMAGATSGMLLERDHQTFRIILLVGAIALWLGSILYRRIPAPAEPKLIEQERAEHRPKPRPWRDAIAILQKDRGFSRYMAAMFVFGSGNLDGHAHHHPSDPGTVRTGILRGHPVGLNVAHAGAAVRRAQMGQIF